MRRPVSHFVLLAKRWAWMIIVGIAICGGATYLFSKLLTPVYSASTILIINLGTSSSAYDNINGSELAVPTYAQLLSNPLVLNPVVAEHTGLTLQQLNTMISVKPQSNTQLIELDVTNSNPQLAMQLSNEISSSFAQFSNSQLPGTVQILPAQLPKDPIRPKPLQDAGIGALVGLGFAIALIVIFEWFEDHVASFEQVQELLGMEILTVIPQLASNPHSKKLEETSVSMERYRMLGASLNNSQAISPFKLVMFTSALADEGKSTLAKNTAIFLAMSGKRILLVDVNMRQPALDQDFQLHNQVGLSNAFLERWTPPKAELFGQATNIPTLRVLTAGVIPSNPAELLQSSPAEQIFEHYKNTPFDYIIFDAPPLLPTADAQILASYAQAIILVIDVAKTPHRALVRVKQVLKRMRTPVLGVVINKSPWTDFADIQPGSS